MTSALVFIHLPANRKGIDTTKKDDSRTISILRLLFVSLPFFLLASSLRTLSIAVSRETPIGLHKRYQHLRFFQVDSAVGAAIFKLASVLAGGESVTLAVVPVSVEVDSFTVAEAGGLEVESFTVMLETEAYSSEV